MIFQAQAQVVCGCVQKEVALITNC